MIDGDDVDMSEFFDDGNSLVQTKALSQDYPQEIMELQTEESNQNKLHRHIR